MDLVVGFWAGSGVLLHRRHDTVPAPVQFDDGGFGCFEPVPVKIDTRLCHLLDFVGDGLYGAVVDDSVDECGQNGSEQMVGVDGKGGATLSCAAGAVRTEVGVIHLAHGGLQLAQ